MSQTLKLAIFVSYSLVTLIAVTYVKVEANAPSSILLYLNTCNLKLKVYEGGLDWDAWLTQIRESHLVFVSRSLFMLQSNLFEK